jgi:acyl-CoA thioesterase
MLTEQEIVKKKMYENDPFSQWLGIEITKINKGSVELSMTIRPEMCNGFGIAHGGITYSLADSALAFAANSHGIQSLSIETSINHLKPLKSGDRLTAVAFEDYVSKSLGHYRVEISCRGSIVALFKGMVYRTGEQWV